MHPQTKYQAPIWSNRKAHGLTEYLCVLMLLALVYA